MLHYSAMDAALPRATIRELGRVAPLARDLDVHDAAPHVATPR
jgi:hypothetical protein